MENSLHLITSLDMKEDVLYQVTLILSIAIQLEEMQLFWSIKNIQVTCQSLKIWPIKTQPTGFVLDVPYLQWWVLKNEKVRTNQSSQNILLILMDQCSKLLNNLEKLGAFMIAIDHQALFSSMIPQVLMFHSWSNLQTWNSLRKILKKEFNLKIQNHLKLNLISNLLEEIYQKQLLKCLNTFLKFQRFSIQMIILVLLSRKLKLIL